VGTDGSLQGLGGNLLHGFILFYLEDFM